MASFDLTRVLEWTDSFLPGWAKVEGDEFARSRARLLVATVLGAVGVTLASTLFHVWSGSVERAVFNLACIPLAGIVLAIPHWTGRRAQRRVPRNERAPAPSLRPTIDAFLAVLLCATAVSPLFSPGEFRVPVLLATIPFLAATLGGLRAGIAWTVITLAALSAMTWAVWTDPVRGLVAWNALVVAAVVGVGGCLAEAARDAARRTAQAANRQAAELTRQRDEQEAELRAGRELLAHTFERVPAMLILSDAATGRIIDVNERFEALSGWPREEVRGRTLSELDAWVSLEDRNRLLATMLSDGHTRDVEILLRTRSRAEIWLLAAADIIRTEARVLVLARGIDITDRKRTENALASSRRLLEERVEKESAQLQASHRELREQRQLAAIGTLAAGIAHQINNPIASLMAAAEYALLAAPEAVGEEATELRDRALRTAIAEATRCGQIVRNVLRFARQQPTARWVEDVATLVVRAATLSRAYVAEHGGQLAIEVGRVPLPARVSPIEIEQVVVNLIRNAAEAIEPGGRVVVSTSRQRETFEIGVEDDGRGMSAEQLEHIFEPFFTTRVQEGGTGLGLAFAHGVIVDHGGEVLVDSQEGKGTRIRIRLPLAPESFGTSPTQQERTWRI